MSHRKVPEELWTGLIVQIWWRNGVQEAWTENGPGEDRSDVVWRAQRDVER